MEQDSVGAIIRKNESDFIGGTTQISKYVSFQLHDTINKIEAYLNSRHISGQTDSQNRKKPFFNIVVAASNIWFRATDIDRSNIRIRATKTVDWIDAFLATVHLRDWMRREAFGQFLNEWGRVLARYGSAVIKFVETDGALHIYVVPWNTIICDSIDIDNNPKIEVLELTPAQLYERIETHGYDKKQVKLLCEAVTEERETIGRRRKDNKPGYIKVYEMHAKLSKQHLTGKKRDAAIYVNQVHVISFVGKMDGASKTYQDFTLYAGEEKKNIYITTHLIKEDGRSLSIGAVEHLFESQFMENHSKISVKNALDVAGKYLLQTADKTLGNRNVLDDMENGDIIVHGLGAQDRLMRVDNGNPAIAQWQAFSAEWKAVGNEITGISEAMLGVAPKSGTAWRQTEAVLQESYSLFELMTENKGLYIEQMLREWVIPYIKKQMDTSKEVMATLEDYEVKTIDEIYLKKAAIRRYNERSVDEVLKFGADLADGKNPSPIQPFDAAAEQKSVQEGMRHLGSTRGFVPSELSDKTWKDQFKNLEWEVEVDVTGESFDTKDALTTLNTALKLVVTPGFDQNPRAQAIVGRVLELTGAMSPIEYNALPSPPPAQPVQPTQPVAPAAPSVAAPVSTG